MLQAENDALRDDVAAIGRRSISQFRQSCVATTASAEYAASPDWQTPLNGLFHPQREVDHYAKTTGRNPEVY